jgi:oxygen-independent coproporphyrinogen-3 oxidase
MSYLFDQIRSNFTVLPTCEISVEVNPETVSPDLLNAYHQLGVNRISIGIQSFNSRDLEFLGRRHSLETAINALTHIQNSCIKNFNIDLIMGLPHFTQFDVMHTLENALSFNPSHISSYTLSIEPNTRFQRHNIQPLASDQESIQFNWISDALTAAGFNHYEISAFAKPGFTSRHNETYWMYEPFIGIGPSANSFFENRRYSNPSALQGYINHPIPQLPKEMCSDDLIKEFLISNLRLRHGFQLAQFEKRFGHQFVDYFGDSINQLMRKGLIIIEDERCLATSRGWLLLDEVLLDLI